MLKPIIAVTMGDVNGVGPEVSLKALYELRKSADFRTFILGSFSVLKNICALVGVNPDLLTEVNHPSEIPEHSEQIFVCCGGDDFKGEIEAGKIASESGRVSIAWVKQAVLWMQEGHIAAMSTAPICKEAIEPFYPGFQGHTEFIGEMCGDPEPVLCLVHGDWVAAHVSTHCSLREACDRVTPERISKTALLLNDFLKKLKYLDSPKIGVAGLNPHAGENGLFGREEIDIIAPTVKKLQEQNINAIGPIPGDVIFPQLKAKTYDGVVAMYHDQGHVVTKTLAFDLGEVREMHGVNLTLGLPVIRTSVDHGTGFDIAHKGIANHQSMIEAIEVAYKMI
jgi:4-hydroxythreonine-4-phosphate dehydrogenase